MLYQLETKTQNDKNMILCFFIFIIESMIRKSKIWLGIVTWQIQFTHAKISMMMTFPCVSFYYVNHEKNTNLAIKSVSQPPFSNLKVVSKSWPKLFFYIFHAFEFNEYWLFYQDFHFQPWKFKCFKVLWPDRCVAC